MTEHNPIKPPKPEGGEEEKSSLLERASGAFGLSNLGAAPMPRSFDDVPMKRARPLRKTVAPAPAPETDAGRASMLHFLEGLLRIDPARRWSPRQALRHPFVTGEPFQRSHAPPEAGFLARHGIGLREPEPPLARPRVAPPSTRTAPARRARLLRPSAARYG